ncbi:MAG: periplasmic heavy metal sensor [Desulfovibrio sp.]|nr:periplasmic heavy metal sensor [Desulfovibrio sp.]
MKFSGKICGLALAALIFAGMTGFADAAQRGNRNGLTPDQQRMAEEIFNENYAAMDATRRALTEKRALLDEEMASPNPDPAAIERLSREIGELRGRMLAARAKARAELVENGLSADLYAPAYPGRGQSRDQGVWYGHRGHYGDRGGHHGPRGGGHWRGGPCCW